MPIGQSRRVAVATLCAAAAGLGVLAAGGQIPTAARAAGINQTTAALESVVDRGGALRVPANYRSTYTFLGNWAVAAKDGAGDAQMHVVYASPGAAASFKSSGHFADGSVLVKEVFEAAVDPMTTGIVSRQKKLLGWFVMVRDSKNTHPDSKLWGDGWGWSWFNADNPTKTTTVDYTAECKSCHIPAESTDWIYTGGYPVLDTAEPGSIK